MSHFLGLVIGHNVEEQLAKYDENQEVVFKDETKEYKQEYENGIFSPSHKFHDGEPVFFHEYYKTFEEFCSDYHEVKTNEEGRYGYFHNPDAKWDWWVIGGRWQGWLLVKENPKFPDAIRKGKASFMGGYSEGILNADVCAICDVDWEGMKQEAINRAAAEWDMAVKEKAAGKKNPFVWIQWGRTKEQGLHTRESYISENASVLPYCIIINGEWYQKGEMGWWGMSNNEMSCEEWANKVEMLFDSLPETTLISVVDFHI